jgi:hypothetical protein
MIYGLRDMTDLAKLVSWDFKVKSRPNLIHINWAFALVKLKKIKSTDIS